MRGDTDTMRGQNSKIDEKWTRGEAISVLPASIFHRFPTVTENKDTDVAGFGSRRFVVLRPPVEEVRRLVLVGYSR